MQEVEAHNGNVNFVCAKHVSVFIENLNYAVRIVPSTYLNGSRLSKLSNDLSDHFKYNDVISCMVGLKCHGNGWRHIRSVHKIDDSNSKEYCVQYGHVINLIQHTNSDRWSGRVAIRNGDIYDFKDYNFAGNFEDYYSNFPLNKTIMVGFTVKAKFGVMFRTTSNVRKKLVSIVPLIDFKDIKECFGTFVCINHINNKYVVMQDNHNEFGNICLFPATFMSNGEIFDDTGKEQFHLQIIKNLPGELQKFVAVSVHLTSDCESAHHSDSWVKSVLPKMPSRSRGNVTPRQTCDLCPTEVATESGHAREGCLVVENPLRLPTRILAVLRLQRVNATSSVGLSSPPIVELPNKVNTVARNMVVNSSSSNRPSLWIHKVE